MSPIIDVEKHIADMTKQDRLRALRNVNPNIISYSMWVQSKNECTDGCGYELCHIHKEIWAGFSRWLYRNESEPKFKPKKSGAEGAEMAGGGGQA